MKPIFRNTANICGDSGNAEMSDFGERQRETRRETERERHREREREEEIRERERKR